MNADTDKTNTDLFYKTLIQSCVETPHFVKRIWLAKQVEEALADPACRFLLLTAEPGAGKTTFSAWLAHQHLNWLRYFIRRDSQTPLSSGDARSFLFAIGHQFAARYPACFRLDKLEVIVRQHGNELQAEARVVGIEVEDLEVSPFYQTALQVEQDIELVTGELVGLSAKRMVTNERFLQLSNLAHLALLDPATVLLQEDDAARIVILVDALDELRYHPGQDNILKWLASCPELPSNLRIVLTSRPDDELLSAFKSRQHASLREETIDLDSEDVKTDLRRYAVGFAAEESIMDALTQQDVSTGEFVTQAVEKAEGNFQYLAALFRGIERAVVQVERSGLDERARNKETLIRLLRFENVPTGLEELYACFLTLIRDSVIDQEVQSERRRLGEKAESQPAWEWLYQPILGVLAVAREPLAAEQIRRLGDIQVEDRWLQMALEHLEQFLDRRGQRFRLYHSTFPEFLTSSQAKAAYSHCYLDPFEWHLKVVNHYRGEADSWENVDWSKVDEYGLLYLASHLYSLSSGAALHNELCGLICKPFMEAKFGCVGSHRAFVEDISLVIKAISASRTINWVQLVRACLVHATFVTLIANLPQELLSVLARLGQVAKAWSYAELMLDARQRCTAYLVIGEALPAREDSREVRETLDRALAAAEAIESEDSRAVALSQVAQALAQAGMRLRAAEVAGCGLAAAEAVIGEGNRTRALAKVAQALIQAGDRERAAGIAAHVLASVEAIRDERFRAEALNGIAEALALTGDEEGLRRALAVTEAIGSEGHQSEALSGVAQALAQTGDEQGLRRAVKMAGAIEGERARAKALNETAQALAQTGDTEGATRLAARALSAAEAIRNESNRAEALSWMIRTLVQTGDEEGLRRAVKMARAIEDETARAEALSGVAQALAQAGETKSAARMAEDALALTKTKEDEWNYTRTLIKVAQALVQAGKVKSAEQLAGRVLATVETIRDDTDRDQVLSTATPFAYRVTRSVRYRAWQGTKTAEFLVLNLIKAFLPLARAFTRQKEDEVAWLLIAAWVTAQERETEKFARLIARALATAEAIENDYRRVMSMSWIASALAHEGETEKAAQVAVRALAVAEGIEDEFNRAEALCKIAYPLALAGESDGLRRVLLAVEMFDEFRRASTLGRIAGILADADQGEFAQRVLLDAFTTAMLAGRRSMFDVLQWQGDTLRGFLDPGQTLQDVRQAVLEIDSWWGVQ